MGWRSWRAQRRRSRARRILIIVENCPVPQDHRVWKECQALVDAGYDVSVIAPRADGQRQREELARVRIYRYFSTRERSDKLGFLLEFASAWAQVTALTAYVFARDGFAAIQACNPPDILFTVALPYKLVGCPFVFDQHDLSPELYVARYGRAKGVVFRALEILERATFRSADHVIAANRPQAEAPLTRGRKPHNHVTIVSNGPVLPSDNAPAPDHNLRRGKTFLCCWVGAMGAVDDGVDLAVRAIGHVVHDIGRSDCHFVFLGHGEAFDDVTRLVEQLQLSEWITFTGWVDHDTVLHYLASADIGLQPDPKNPRTDKATAVKTLEYMAFGVPVVAFDLEETRRTVASAGVYATPNDPCSFAAAIDDLLSDPDRRREMGATGRSLVRGGLSWDHQRVAYVGVYDALLHQGWREPVRGADDRRFGAAMRGAK
jgi:glycosyltransferase involved in cell wall biosynthesis